MIPYRDLKPKTSRHKSLRKAAREQWRQQAAVLRGDNVAAPPLALPPAPTKLHQLDALVRAGRVSDPLADIQAMQASKQESAGSPVRPSGPSGMTGMR